jgi:hypothetical protein
MPTQQCDSTRGRWIAAAMITLSLSAAGCATGAATKVAAEPPAKVEAIAGKDVKSVRLTEQAAKRLGIATTMIAVAGSAVPGTPTTVPYPASAGVPGTPTTVPYSAVIYTPDGTTWVYTVTQPRTYVREKVVVANVGGAQGTEAFLSAGPAVGTEVVKTGLVELYGAELGVGK